METTKPAALPALLGMKCPNCRKGRMFKQKGFFPLGHLLDMPERCPVCSQKMELEPGFYYGTGYVSYGLTVGLLAIFAVIFALTYGFSYKDNSVFIFMGIAFVLLLLLQPWLMRISRVLYLWAFVKYGKGSTVSSHE